MLLPINSLVLTATDTRDAQLKDNQSFSDIRYANNCNRG